MCPQCLILPPQGLGPPCVSARPSFRAAHPRQVTTLLTSIANSRFEPALRRGVRGPSTAGASGVLPAYRSDGGFARCRRRALYSVDFLLLRWMHWAQSSRILFCGLHCPGRLKGCIEGEVLLRQEFLLDASVGEAAHKSISEHLLRCRTELAVFAQPSELRHKICDQFARFLCA